MHQYLKSLQLTEVKDAAILGTSTDVELNSLHDGPEDSVVALSREVHPERHRVRTPRIQLLGRIICRINASLPIPSQQRLGRSKC
jgi:hypothetical protein